MPHNNPQESLVTFLGLANAVLAIDSSALYASSTSHIALGVFLHIFTVLALLTWVCYRFYARKNLRFSVMLLVMTTATGPFGAAICVISVVVYSFCSISATHPAEWMNDLFYQEEDENSLYERITFGLDNFSSPTGVKPYQDVMACGTMMQKQITIAKITRYFQPQFAPLLLKALQDANAAVRVQAAASLAKIERHFMSQYVQLEKSLKDTPYSDTSWLQLAKIYEEYSKAGILDEHSLHNLRMKAIQIYESYLVFHYDTEIQIRLGKLCLNHNEAEKANKLLGETIGANRETEPVAILFYIESLFKLKKFSEIRKIVKQYSNELAQLDYYKYGIEVENALSVWSQDVNKIETVQPISENSYAT